MSRPYQQTAGFSTEEALVGDRERGGVLSELADTPLPPERIARRGGDALRGNL